MTMGRGLPDEPPPCPLASARLSPSLASQVRLVLRGLVVCTHIKAREERDGIRIKERQE
jgi:hypothetical protein